MYHEQKELRHFIHELMWFMRGSLSRDEAWTLSPKERMEMLEDVKKRVKTTEETGMPLL